MRNLGRALVLFFAAACNAAAPSPVEPVLSDTAAASSAAPVATVVEPESSPPKAPKVATVSFEDDLAFLKQHGDVLVLTSPSGGRVAVSPKYQARVMTSAVEPNGQSLGFVFRSFIEAGKTGTQFDNYGGEDRIWLGPEAGQYGLYFPKGKPFTITDWKTPDALQTGAWEVASKEATKIAFRRTMRLENYAGTVFDLELKRAVELISPSEVARRLGGSPTGLKWVAFQTTNQLTNIGSKAWTKKQGLLSVWILGMYNPSADTRVVLPFDPHAGGEIVNDRYFGKVPAERLRIDENAGVLLFSCDAQHRSKIGLGPARARRFAGSYSASAKLLTIIEFDLPSPRGEYVNSMWENQKEPYKGDVVNSYNDGPTEPGKPSLGGFYELESSSPAAELASKGSLTHTHRTYHLVGEPAELDAITKHTLGVSVAQIAAP